MRQIIAITMVCFCLLSLVSCESGKKIEAPANFYYCKATIGYNDITGVIAPEIRETKELEDSLLTVLNLYLKGPESDAYRNPFLDGVTLEELELEESTLILTLSQQYSQLSGLELTLANACLCKTAFELTQCNAVRLQCTSSTLDGNTSITLTQDSLLLIDTAETVPAEK